MADPSYNDQVTGFDGIEKIDYLLKRDFQVAATKETTLWFNETFGKSLLTIESDSINVVEPPDEPIWDDISMTNSELNEYDICINVANSFHTDKFTGIQEAYYNGSTKYYRTDGTYTPGAYLDSTKTLILFVALRLDFMETFSSGLTRGDETSSGGNARNKSLSFTKYPNDSSLNSVLSNSFQTNYKKQVGTFAKENGTTISTTLNHYKYTLEYPNSNGVRQELAFSEGNWFFDFKSGVITFSDDPGSNYKFDNDQGANQDYLYLTFVKYVGPTGLKKMLSVDPDFASNSSNSGYYEDQVVIDSTNSKIYLRKDNAWEEIETGSPDPNGIGMGFYPIGAVITWPGTSGPPSDYGTWLLCNGTNKNYNEYPILGALFGSSADNTFTLPNYNNIFIRSTTNSLGSTSGNDNITLSVNNLPRHDHGQTQQHSHSLNFSQHAHVIPSHKHTFTLPAHYHNSGNLANHTHTVDKTFGNHNHGNNLIIGHEHQFTDNYNMNGATNRTNSGAQGSEAATAVSLNSATAMSSQGGIQENTGTANFDLNMGDGTMSLGNTSIDVSSNASSYTSNVSGGGGEYDANFNDASGGDTGQNISNVASFSILPSYIFTSYYIRAN